MTQGGAQRFTPSFQTGQFCLRICCPCLSRQDLILSVHPSGRTGDGLEVPVAHLTFPEFTSVDRVQRSDRLGGLVHEYRVAA